ncbi:MAG: lipid A biosynthesis acyltransferase [Candidatus Rokuibacteriota bacterium]
MRITVWFYRRFGRRLSALFILPVVAYFFLTDGRGRRASRQYLGRVYALPAGRAALGRRPGLRESFRHYREFGLNVLDRLCFAVGDESLDVVFHGREHFGELIAARRGALLLGAHLGSFDALRALATQAGIVVHVLMFTRHAPRINALLRRLNPDVDVRVVDLAEASLDAVFRLRGCVERGEFVAILGDRVGAGERARVAHAPFLGAPAPFPQGPFILASALRCPVLLMVGLRRSRGRYDVFAEPLVERVVLPPAEHARRLDELVAAYARRLEWYCLQAPYQWFNFFDFWDDERLASGSAPA